MTLHQKIVITQLVLNYLNDIIIAREVTDNVLQSKVMSKVVQLKEILKSEYSLEDYIEIYTQWDEARLTFETHSEETKIFCQSKKKLESYLEQLLTEYTNLS